MGGPYIPNSHPEQTVFFKAAGGARPETPAIAAKSAAARSAVSRRIILRGGREVPLGRGALPRRTHERRARASQRRRNPGNRPRGEDAAPDRRAVVADRRGDADGRDGAVDGEADADPRRGPFAHHRRSRRDRRRHAGRARRARRVVSACADLHGCVRRRHRCDQRRRRGDLSTRRGAALGRSAHGRARRRLHTRDPSR